MLRAPAVQMAAQFTEQRLLGRALSDFRSVVEMTVVLGSRGILRRNRCTLGVNDAFDRRAGCTGSAQGLQMRQNAVLHHRLVRLIEKFGQCRQQGRFEIPEQHETDFGRQLHTGQCRLQIFSQLLLGERRIDFFRSRHPEQGAQAQAGDGDAVIRGTHNRLGNQLTVDHIIDIFDIDQCQSGGMFRAGFEFALEFSERGVNGTRELVLDGLTGSAEKTQVFDVRRTDGRLILLADIVEEGIGGGHGVGNDAHQAAFCGGMHTAVDHVAIWRGNRRHRNSGFINHE